MKFKILLWMCLISGQQLFTQNLSNAHARDTKDTGHFLYGSNVAYLNGNGSDHDVADILTETNAPNKEVLDFIGSEEAQRNSLMKRAIMAQKNNISTVYPYCSCDTKEPQEDGREYDYKGFYFPLTITLGSDSLRMDESGIGWQTMSQLLQSRKYHPIQTALLKLPAEVEGGAFYSEATNDYIYVLWAKTSIDESETASATYQFPAFMNVNQVWVTASNHAETLITGSTIQLTDAPVFISLHKGLSGNHSVTGVTLNQSRYSIPKGKNFTLVAQVLPADAANRNVIWSSSHPGVATIDSTGKVTALAVGTTLITVTTAEGGYTATCLVEVLNETVAL